MKINPWFPTIGVFADTNSNNIGEEYRTVNLLKKPQRIPRDSKGEILVFFIEHQWVYLEREVVNEGEDYTIPFGQARIVKEGKDITFKNIKRPVRIISGYDITPPMAYPLETENMPSPERIVRSIRKELKE